MKQYAYAQYRGNVPPPTFSPIWFVLTYWPCTHYRKGPIAENSYLFQYRVFLLFFVYKLSNISIN